MDKSANQATLTINPDKFSLKLFVSIDLVGSTALKNKPSDKPQHWIEPFNEFYNKTINRFINESNLESKSYSKEKYKYQSPIVWKLLGDEVIFCIDIKYSGVIPIYINALKKTLSSFRKTVKKKQWSLDAKATMWLAGFPIFNSMIDIELEKESSNMVDYIGPSMDIGFRLTKFATPRKITISIELLYLLCHIEYSHSIHIFTNSKEELKGVLQDKTYPIFWVDSYGDKNKNDKKKIEKLEKKIYTNQKQEVKDLKEYSKLFIQENSDSLFAPFIEGEYKSEFKKNEKKAKEKLKKLKDFLESINVSRPKKSSFEKNKNLKDKEPALKEFIKKEAET